MQSVNKPNFSHWNLPPRDARFTSVLSFWLWCFSFPRVSFLAAKAPSLSLHVQVAPSAMQWCNAFQAASYAVLPSGGFFSCSIHQLRSSRSDRLQLHLFRVLPFYRSSLLCVRRVLLSPVALFPTWEHFVHMQLGSEVRLRVAWPIELAFGRGAGE